MISQFTYCRRIRAAHSGAARFDVAMNRLDPPRRRTADMLSILQLTGKTLERQPGIARNCSSIRLFALVADRSARTRNGTVSPWNNQEAPAAIRGVPLSSYCRT